MFVILLPSRKQKQKKLLILACLSGEYVGLNSGKYVSIYLSFNFASISIHAAVPMEKQPKFLKET